MNKTRTFKLDIALHFISRKLLLALTFQLTSKLIISRSIAETDAHAVVDEILALLEDGCSTCILTAIVSALEDEEVSSARNFKNKSLFYGRRKTDLFVGFQTPKDRKDPTGVEQAESAPVTDFDYLVKKMLSIMQQWTNDGRAQGFGAALRIKKADGFPARGPTPDITVEIRNRFLKGLNQKPAKQEWHSLLGSPSADPKNVPSIIMDFGEYTQATFESKKLADVKKVEFFTSQVPHEFGHALGFIHKHFHKTFQEKYFKGKLDPATRKVLIARLKQNSVYKDSGRSYFGSDVFDMPRDKNKVSLPPMIDRAWVLTTDAPDLDSVMMYPFGYVNDEVTGKKTDLILADKGVEGLEVKRFTTLSRSDLMGAAWAYYDAGNRKWAKPSA
ncbi:hypothetical protein EJ08DRAFT_691913 [Tothia fuscella]|uniref:Uncharacterized protein n=1 Tax=Tothia fuscella TaxID=1048955 RepID=A0A9P4P2B8_9PEZI|nr:hypothetical protein EJ08DRAFT_691913 [Tothia fuscella]